MAVTVLQGDVHVAGSLTAGKMTLPEAVVSDKNVAAGAAIDPNKSTGRGRFCYAQESDTSAATESRVIHAVYGTLGELISFRAGSVVANIGAATVTVDLLLNGVSVLTAPITLSASHTAYQLVAATFSVSSIATTNVLEVAIAATAGGGTLAKGVFAELVLNESGT